MAYYKNPMSTELESVVLALKPSKKEKKSAEIFRCKPCEYESGTKTNFTRHCCSIAHLTKCDLPLPAKKPTKKVRDALAAAEAAVAAEAAHQVELARVAGELRVCQEAAAALHVAELARLAEELRLREAELALAAELAKPKHVVRKEMWAHQAAAKLEAKELERTDRAAYREKREADRAVERLRQKELKKVEYLEKCKTRLAEYVISVCAEEVRDVQKMAGAPTTLIDYLDNPERLGNYLSPYFGYTPESHRALMRKLSTDAANQFALQAQGYGGAGVLVDFGTERGKQKLTRLTDFHSTFRPKPWMPERENLRYTCFYFEGVSYGAYYDSTTMRVYDFDVTIEIGRYDERHEITFVAGMPTPDVLEN